MSAPFAAPTATRVLHYLKAAPDSVVHFGAKSLGTRPHLADLAAAGQASTPPSFTSPDPATRARRMPLLGFAIGRRPSFPSKDVKRHPLADSRSSSETSLKAGLGLIDRRSSNTMEHHFKLPGLSKHHADRKQSGQASPSQDARRPVKMDWDVESPPLISYNPPQQSSGALFSAQLILDVIDPSVVLDKFEVQLLCIVTVKKPVTQHCPDCATKTTELKRWVFAHEPLTLQHGKHRFPFSYLFPGRLPATTHAHLAKLDYYVAAEAITSAGDTITFGREVHLARAIIPGPQKHSMRVFPPTNLTAHASLNPIIHPIGEIPVSLRLSGITTKQNDAQIRWRLRKMSWRIEEHQKMISHTCPKHAQKVSGEDKGTLHEETRVIGEDEVNYNKQPWKTDFDAGDVECQFKAAVNPNLKPVCDVSAPNGLSVSHSLFIEMVVAEEWVPLKKTHQVTPTGAARILRMQFYLIMTERAGMGISWDEETPPVYQDVPASPPSYANMVDYDIAELSELGHVEDLQLGDPLRRPLIAGPSTARPWSSGASRSPAPSPGSPRLRLDAADLLQEPPELRERRSIDEDVLPSVDMEQGPIS